MGQIRILPDQVANQIAAGEVVDRPASVVKELLENALDAGAMRIRVEVEGGGRKLIRVSDDGHGMNRDDALLAFERHATSKLRTADDLLSIATLGFRGEALPSIASVARVTLETATGDEAAAQGARVGTHLEVAGGKIHRVEDAALPRGTTIAVADLFFNTPARRKFLRAESTELAHVTALGSRTTRLAHPEKQFDLLSSSHTILSAPPVARTAERIFQVFGKETLSQLLPVAAEILLERAGLPEPPPWKRDPHQPPRQPGSLRLTGFYSKPELQKLNRNSIYIFINKRLIRDRLLLHAITEAYRNVIPPTSFPVVLLFLEMPPEEVDVNVHPAKTEVRFRQAGHIHDFVRDSLRTALIKARPAAGFLAALDSQPSASPSLMPPAASPLPGAPDSDPGSSSDAEPFHLTPRIPAPFPGSFAFGTQNPDPRNLDPSNLVAQTWSEAANTLLAAAADAGDCSPNPNGTAAYGDNPAAATAAATALVEAEQAANSLNRLGSLKPIGQLRDSLHPGLRRGRPVDHRPARCSRKGAF